MLAGLRVPYLGAWMGLLGCGMGIAPSSAEGPRVLDVTPVDGATGVSRSPRFVVSLDRPVGPRGFPAESVLLVSGERRVPLRIISDPTTHRFEVIPRGTLDPNVGYRLELGAFRDVEGRPAAPRTIHIETGPSVIPDPGPGATWADAAVVLARCTMCHGGDMSVLGLDLSTAEAVRRTAIAVPAEEVRVGDPVSLGGGLLGLARIEPGAPGRSYLVWKLSGDEHIVGDPMPPDDALDPAEVATLVAWVRSGAPTD